MFDNKACKYGMNASKSLASGHQQPQELSADALIPMIWRYLVHYFVISRQYHDIKWTGLYNGSWESRMAFDDFHP